MISDLALPELAGDSNKYTRGRLVIVAGSARYPGAAVLAARASQRMGTGYTEVVTAKSAVPLVLVASPSLVARPFSDWDPGKLEAVRDGHPLAVCVGPGFVPGSSKAEARTLRVLGQASHPVLVDGGALSALSSKRALKVLADRADRGLPTVVTPHGGEAARLAEPLMLRSGDPRQLSAALALSLRSVVVLKGSDTYVSDGKRVEAMTEGTPALAKAGTGDVLAGMIGSLLAQGLAPFDAALTGAVLHARAGKLAAQAIAPASVCAEDVVEVLPVVLR